MRHSVNHRPWVNFKELRARLKFEDVLRHYKVEVRKRGTQHLGPCPLPTHVGNRLVYSFSANLERGIFQCFGCKASGNLLEFAAIMSGVNPEDGIAFRKIAVELQGRFLPEGASTRSPRDDKRDAPETAMAAQCERSVNTPLDFHLKGLDTSHPAFAEAGLSQATVDHFGLGYCLRGSFKDKIVIPLHDVAGALVGYAGCDVENFTTDALPLTFPENRARQGVLHAFDKSTLLYNRHRLRSPCADLIVTTEIESVWRAHQLGRARVVAILGDSCSLALADKIVQLVEPFGRIWFVPKGGHPLAGSFIDLILPQRFIRLGKLSDRCSLAALPDQDIAALLGS